MCVCVCVSSILPLQTEHRLLEGRDSPSCPDLLPSWTLECTGKLFLPPSWGGIPRALVLPAPLRLTLKCAALGQYGGQAPDSQGEVRVTH